VTALTNDDRHGRRAAFALAALTLLLGLCAAVVLSTAAEPASAARAKLLGKTKGTPRSQCPKPSRNCQAVGRLTGFQLRASKSKNPFVAKQAGSLVAWSVDLTGRPKPSQRRFFGKLYGHKPFGTNPSARVAILKKKKGKKYKLKSQSPPVDLSDSIGEKPIFTLGKPLRMAKGDILAITLPTWTSAFAVGVSTNENVWTASRPGNACEVGTEGQARKNLKKSKPQEEIGSARSYGCTYEGARLLYWGYYVPS
jgi:hypothetical protein